MGPYDRRGFLGPRCILPEQGLGEQKPQIPLSGKCDSAWLPSKIYEFFSAYLIMSDFVVE